MPPLSRSDCDCISVDHRTTDNSVVKLDRPADGKGLNHFLGFTFIGGTGSDRGGRSI